MPLKGSTHFVLTTDDRFKCPVSRRFSPASGSGFIEPTDRTLPFAVNFVSDEGCQLAGYAIEHQ